jgi:two-component system sensor kinase FixL
VNSEAIIRNVSIEKAFDRDVPPVLGDRIHLQQVILNSILNASEAMAETKGDCRKMIISTSREDEHTLRVSIRDHGPGIDDEHLNRMFEPFYTTKPQGMGMGLSINRSIIEAHGGRLWAENHPDGGAIFHFTLPISDFSA